MDILLALGIALAGYCFQVWPRLINRYFGIDTWRFTLLAQYIRDNKKLPESLPHKYLVPGSVDNPPLLPWLCSLLPKDWLDRNQGLISPAFDVLSSLTVYAMGVAASGQAAGGHLAQIVYLLTPVVPLEASNLSLRTLGGLIFTWAMLGVLGYTAHPGVVTFVLAVAGVVLLSMTHRMAMQVLFFTLFWLAMVEGSIRPLLAFAVGLLVSIFATRGLYLRYLRGHLLMISFWMYNIQNRLAHQVRGNPTAQRKHTDFVRRIEYLIWKIPVAPFFAVNPWILYVFCAVFSVPAADNLWLSLFVKWSVILFFLGILFNLPLLRFLGEGQRYLEFGTTAAAAAAGTMILKFAAQPSLPGIVHVLPCVIGVGCFALIVFFQVKLVVRNPDKSVTPALRAVIAHLNGRPHEVRLACLPHGLADAMAYFLNNGRVLLSDNSVGVWELADWFPLITKPLREIADKYDLNAFLVSTTFVTPEEIDLPGFSVTMRQGNLIVYERNS
ncbi:hypothetical protein JCM15519_23240 [Fundidesulfovibrio butyratiphilus]